MPTASNVNALLKVTVDGESYRRMMVAKSKMHVIASTTRRNDIRQVEKFAAWMDAAIEFDTAAETLYKVQVQDADSKRA